jgi:putative ATPase
MPEGRFPLAQAALYLATCPKSNSALAFFDALAAVESEQESEVPTHLRDGNRDSEGFGHGEGYLYPHAYRDHWVAQQYLPDSLQGKAFYEPSGQGYELKIREQVARRREAQLAAMMETDGAVPEVLTTGPADRARDAWLQRTIANSGRNLERLRAKLFELASVQRHHLVLDLNAGTGLLTWEAVRRVPEGGVWSLTIDDNTGTALRQQAQRLPELERPAVLIGEFSELDGLLELRGEAEVQFDAILGRNAFTRQVSSGLQLGDLSARLRPGGRLCLAQIVPRHGQRLYELIDWSAVPDELAHKVKEAEEALYTDPADPLVNWDVADLVALLAAAGFSDVETQVERQVEQRRVTDSQLERWLGPGDGASEPGTYARKLLESGLSEKEVLQVAALYRRKLPAEAVSWNNLIAYVSGRG